MRRSRAIFALAVATAAVGTVCEGEEPVARLPILLEVEAPAGSRPREFLRPQRERLERLGHAVSVRVSDGAGPSISVAAFSGGAALGVGRFDPGDSGAQAAVGRWLDAVVVLADASWRRGRPPVEARKPRVRRPDLRIDGTSGEAFKASLEAILATLEEEEQRDLRRDINLYLEPLTLKAGGDAAEAGRPPTVEDITGFFHGMTAAELHAKAEGFRAARAKHDADAKARREVRKSGPPAGQP